MNFKQYYFKEEFEMNDEMKKHFDERTNKHISLVQKYCKKIDDLNIPGLEDIIKVGEEHDASKFEEPEYTPYIYISWNYKCKADGTKFDLPQDIKNNMNVASNHHVLNNKHHPEAWQEKTDVINRDDRDKPPDEIIDATKMNDLAIAEMTADWCAMSEELGTNTPKEWADKNVNVRWKFTDEQTKLIYELIEKIWKT